MTKITPTDVELATGERLAAELVGHLHRMGAGAATIPVLVRGRVYEVRVREYPGQPAPTPEPSHD
jgi:hypothetical protein